ncbi:MAG: CoA transferase [Xanthobacteraceae bacterium]|nr:CoA transferase [Xanthobacteraceae bacterium]
MTTPSRPAIPSLADLPLHGARVIDFSRLLPGPWCTQTLGDLGADVIKIEQPEVGDYARYNPPTYKTVGAYFNGINRNKRSIALDLTDKKDRESAYKLIDGADIVVESFRDGVPRKLAIDYETLSKRSPSLIYCSITGFGNGSKLGRVPGHDLSIQGVAGTLLKTVEPGQKPSMPSYQGGDFTAAAFATMGVLSAYIRRMKTNAGCYLEIPMFQSLISVSNVGMSGALARVAGYTGTPEMEPWGKNPRYNIYPTRDGKYVTACLLEYRAWQRFCEYIGRSELAPAESWADRHTNHGARTGAIRQALADFCLSRDRDALLEETRAAEIAICAVYTVDEAINSEHAREVGVVGFSEHPSEGRIPHFVDPLAAAGLSHPARLPSPALGQHTEEILQELSTQTRKAATGG